VILNIFVLKKGVQGRLPRAKSHHRGFRNLALVHQNNQNMHFGLNLAPKGPIPLSYFLHN